MKKVSKSALLLLFASSAALAAPSPYSGSSGPTGGLRFQCMPITALLNLGNSPQYSEMWAAGCYG